MLHCILVGFKNIVYGIIHAVCLGNVTMALFSLILVKIALLYSCYKFKACYINKFYYYSSCLYFTIGIVIDGCILLDNLIYGNNWPAQHIDVYKTVQYLLLYALIMTVLIKVIYTIFAGIKHVISEIINVNTKIIPET